MPNQLLIARHGNTFAKGDTLRRVGARTDIPLVASGIEQAKRLGLYLRENNIKLAAAFSGPLKRAKQTAIEALQNSGNENVDLIIDSSFNEIDYGSDDGRAEDEVICRIGKEALKKWDEDAIAPKGWLVEPEKIIQDWQNFAQMLLEKYTDKTILVVTSNGTARFAPYLTGNFEEFKKNYKIKMATGAVSSMIFDENSKIWQVKYWNLKPKNWLENYNIEI